MLKQDRMDKLEVSKGLTTFAVTIRDKLVDLEQSVKTYKSQLKYI